MYLENCITPFCGLHMLHINSFMGVCLHEAFSPALSFDVLPAKDKVIVVNISHDLSSVKNISYVRCLGQSRDSRTRAGCGW